MRSLLFLGSLLGCTAAPELHDRIYVSTTGDDANPGTLDAPFRTLERARLAVRRLAPRMTTNLVVEIGPGDYVLAQPLAFDEGDSGTNGHTITYRAEPGTVRVLGGRPITAWRPYAGEILSAHLDRGPVYTLYEDGIRADEARYPNRAAVATLSHAPYLISAGIAASHRVVQSSGDLPLIADASALKVFIWSHGGKAWFTDTVPVQWIDHATGQIELAEATRYEIGTGSRYFLEGALELLDAPGEFFVDAASSTLYYWPRSATPGEVIAPALTSLVMVRGASADQPVHDLRFEGLGFVASDFTDWYRFGYPSAGDSGERHAVPAFDRQLEMPAHRRGMITLENTERVEIAFSHIVDAGYGGIYLAFANRGDRIYGNLVEHVGIDGVAIQGGYPGEGDISRDNVISNNLIHHVGELAGHGAGIDVLNSGSNELANDWVHDSPRFGILIHAIAGTPGDELYARDNVVRDVALDATSQDSGDTAALYTYGVAHDGSMPSPNTFRDIAINSAIADPSMRDLAPNGVFTDNDSSQQRFTNIRVDRAAGAPYRSNASMETMTNVSWEAAFDDAALDPGIGLAEDFPASYR